VSEIQYIKHFFIRNDAENDERLKKTIRRYLSILFNTEVNTPTQDENGMSEGMASSSASACLSRQVGAAIYSADGELIGIGANDVPKRGGSIYSVDDNEFDHRCYKWGGKICHNDDRKHRLNISITEQLRKLNLISAIASETDVESALLNTDIRNLIEYSRAVHAEQEAIVSVARGQKAGIVGSTMYSTTFPCHSCAALIVVSGILKVIYIEPYEKSLALALHRDAISVRENDKDTHVLFLQYEGVAPKNIIRLFNHGLPRKKDGRLIEREGRKATLVFPSPLDGFDRREQIVVHRVAEAEAKGSGKIDDGRRQESATEPASSDIGQSE
jgi:deoxycytidylate deaminase